MVPILDFLSIDSTCSGAGNLLVLMSLEKTQVYPAL